MDVKSSLSQVAASVASLSSIFGLILLWIGYRICVALYNISPFHPLSRFPGPQIAAVSYLYEAYYDWWLVGRYGKVIAGMHEKYGPIVRINPDELHCSDPNFTDEIYAGSGRSRDKWQHQLNTGAAGPLSMAAFSTVNHDLHRARRTPFNKFFSRQQMLKLEGEVFDFAQKTTEKMLASAGKGAFNVKEAFNCFTGDVISQYAFGEPMGFVAQETWEPNLTTWMGSFTRSAYMMRHNTLARKIAVVLPFMADYLGEDVRAIMKVMNVTVPGYITAALKNPENGHVFMEVMSGSKTLTKEDRYRFDGEGFMFLVAGTETTAAILTIFTYWMLAKPEIYKRLMSELSGLTPETVKWIELEKRPYLWGILQECLRMVPGVSQRSARIAREEDLHYRSEDGESDWVIPRGTPIGMTSMINHWNTKLFPEPDEFLPERWLTEEGRPNVQLQKKLIAFGKGSRGCIGENLAYCELYIMCALMAFEIIPRARLVDTTLEDVAYDHDLIVVQSKRGALSVKIGID
ncbi:cytochrome P450 monooxygenase-like protein [Ophiobolus disseminans]|uniref:Cytochrome P450 monooxygenase-like protein n=1 Tax=Ophiobolus disseminans TaxID=1469910 RepID=A0A6A7A3N7_9PLEO|nr:cytochrome P450 monooxygenase-like protein [Ophiobolus disseminans]